MKTIQKSFLSFATLLCVGLALTLPAYAEKNDDTPVTRYAKETEALEKELSEEQVLKYQKIRNAHGIIRSVQSIEAIVEKAVKSCKKEHKTLGSKVEARFAEWRVAVRPVIKSGKDRLDKLILLQDYAKPSDVKLHLKNFDAAAKYGESLIDLKPAKDEKSCTALLESMNKTQPDLIRLLKENIGIK